MGIGEPFCIYKNASAKEGHHAQGGDKGRDLTLPQKKPFTAPHPMPTAKATKMAAPAFPVDSRIPEARTPASPRMEPTERSIPR